MRYWMAALVAVLACSMPARTEPWTQAQELRAWAALAVLNPELAAEMLAAFEPDQDENLNEQEMFRRWRHFEDTLAIINADRYDIR